MAAHKGEIDIPPNASWDPDATELLRAWTTKGSLEVCLKRAWDKPDAWGILLTDLARHVARAFAHDGICTEAEALKRIRSVLDAEWDEPTDLGSTQLVRKQ